MTTREQLVQQVAAHLHAEQHIEGARLVADFSGIPSKRVVDRSSALELLNSLLYWCLSNDRYDLAAQMLWGETLFTYRPRCTQLVWREIKNTSSLLLQGAASMSKSYGCGVWLLLDWIRDPEYTSVNLVGPSEDHLKDNLFTHMVTLHRSATIPLPGIIGDLFIGLDPKSRKGAIRGIVIPIGKRPAGRLQGRKRVPRKTPHPQFGKLSRMRIFLDEFEKIPIGVHKDIDNVFANLDGDVEGFKLIAAYNPEDINGQVAQRAEPEGGWEHFNPETDEVWTSKRGWRVLRLDAAKCENVIEKRIIYPGLQTYEGYNRIIQNAGGVDTPPYYTMARACFPKGGGVYNVISQSLLYKLKAEFIFAEEPINCGAADLALDGGDAAEFAVGRFGKAAGVKFPPSLEHPRGKEIFFTNAQGSRILKWALQLDQIFPLKPGDTLPMALQLKELGEKFHIAPDYFMVDRTGNGAGTHDMLKELWSPEVRGVNYSEGATEKKILVEDTKTAKEEYKRVVSELWFALKRWSEYGLFHIHPAAFSEDLTKELTGRRYHPSDQSRVESKIDYKSRGNKSPNKADVATLLLHGVRMASGVVPSGLAENSGAAIGAHQDAPMIQRVCSTNRFEDLDDSIDPMPAGFTW